MTSLGRLPSLQLEGAGPVVVLEAGLGEGPESWDPVAPLLVPHARVVRPLRPGLDGRPEERGLDRRAVATAMRLHARVSVEGPQPFVLVAHSLGGLTARALRCLHPADVRALVLVDPTVDEQPGGVLALLRAMSAVQRAAAWVSHDPRRRAVAAEQGAFPGSVRQLRELERAPRPAVPGVVLSAGSGRGWQRTASAHARFAERHGLRHVVVAGAGHHVHRDAPALVAAEVTALL